MRVSSIALLLFVLLSSLVIAEALFTPRIISAPWAPRYDHASWTAGSAIFIYGGLQVQSITVLPLSDVWTSADNGVTWKTVLSTGGAIYSNGISFAGSNYIMNGRVTSSGCTSSSDLATMVTSPIFNPVRWQVSTTPYGNRAVAMVTTWTPPPTSGLTETLIHIGGTQCNIGWFDEVWGFSSNTWTNYGNGPFGPIGSAGIATVQFKSQIIIAGGINGTSSNAANMNSVWMGTYSGNDLAPLSWTLVCSAAPWSPSTPTMVSTSTDYLYLLPQSTIGSGVSNDVWASYDAGQSWLQVVASDSFPARRYAEMVAIGRNLFLIGGQDEQGQPLNDVWHAWV